MGFFFIIVKYDGYYLIRDYCNKSIYALYRLKLWLRKF